jgi:hypothetical protein
LVTLIRKLQLPLALGKLELLQEGYEMGKLELLGGIAKRELGNEEKVP